jgi:hypothetical protein
MSNQCHVKPFKVYAGVRGTDGHLRFTVNGSPLHHIVYHSPTGMEWGYPGSGPTDLALSIIADFLDERPSPGDVIHGRCRCVKHYQNFKFAMIVDAPYEGFEIHASRDGFFLRMDDPSKGFELPRKDLPIPPDAHLEASYEERCENGEG